ncbi:alpha beta family hydrolase [Seminavis robusta]|uniref:Alpha beta family hydrolase n=1 Tax=Seminavis robusta TaxID=568900 RepID=A0A9N8E3C0_9STRA|nr:alpha beta family hydrolase [Seminavis robusta]|eukprot:Sro502_g155630.1 alpha beta family hydrolase (261) ;mRNA; f:45540-46322
MPLLQRPCGHKIYYEVKGRGIPILMLAPGGMRSSIPKWENTSKINPWTTLPTAKFMMIGMDQRFANRSIGRARNSDGWETFMDDQIALLDHLEIKRCHIVGSCIGPSYAFNLLVHHPRRFGRCVMLQPIGLARHTTEPHSQWAGLNHDAAWSWFSDFAGERVTSKVYQGKEDYETLNGLYERMFQSGREFVFSITRDQATRIATPLLVFMGRDKSHPAETSRQICRLCQSAELVAIWRNAGPGALEKAEARIEDFLSEPV